MNTSSEYTFPIFISSTDYNLKDLRAELARYLSELGYKPILSSAEGFPDSSPKLEPWESCLPVLDRSFVMCLVIDGRYGQSLPWPNFSELLNERKVSPTHGEYLFAHKTKKRMLVFIRKEVITFYQSYRTVIKKEKEVSKAKNILNPTLPDHIDFETLEFVHNVKTTKPIPWIMEFSDITEVKQMIQKKMLNELAEIFMVKNMKYETVMDAFNKVMDGLTKEEQKKALSKINATKGYTEAVEQLSKYQAELKDTKEKLEKTKKTNTKKREELDNKIKSLNKKIDKLEKDSASFGDSIVFDEDRIFYGGNAHRDSSINIGSNESIGLVTGYSGDFFKRNCEECGRENDQLKLVTSAGLFGFNTCPKCNRYLCSECWPKYGTSYFDGLSSLSSSEKCPKCVKEG